MIHKIIQVSYCDPHSILAINANGIIRQIYCPFRVKCIQPVGEIKPGTWLIVEEVNSTLKDELVYSVQGRNYLYTNFSLHILF